MFPCFIKPGKHYYMVRLDPKEIRKVNNGNNMDDSSVSDLSQFEPEYFCHTMQAPVRQDEIPKFIRQGKSHKVEK